jgi:hypothetical protein
MKLKSTGLKRTASAADSKRSSARSAGRKKMARADFPYFALFIGSQRVSLQFGKAYRVLHPEPKDPDYLLRVVDEEGEDYLYPSDWFARVELSPKAKRALTTAPAH